MEPKTIKINIKSTSGGQNTEIEINQGETVLKLKEQISTKLNIPSDEQNLVYKGRILSNEKAIKDYGMEEGHTVILVKKAKIVNKPPETKTEPEKKTEENAPKTDNNSNPNNNNNANNPFGGMNFPGLGGLDMNQLMQQAFNSGANGGFGGMNMGMGGLNPNLTNQMMGQLLNNPEMMNMVTNMMSNPATLQQMINSNPMLKSLVENNPMMQQIFNNPEALRAMMNPDMLRQAMAMMQGMGGNNGGNNFGFPNMDMNTINQMAQNLGMGFGNVPLNYNAGANNNSNPNPNPIPPQNEPSNIDYKEKYKNELETLKNMGFDNEEKNLNALKACQGNVNFAVEKLLSGA